MRGAIDVVVYGDINIDVMVYTRRLPERGIPLTAESIRIMHGGVGGNIATALSTLNIKVALIGAVGEDVLGFEALRELNRIGVDTSRVRRLANVSTGLMIIFVEPSGERTIIGYRGANSKIIVDDEDLELIKNTRHLHVSGYTFLNEDYGEGALRLLKEAKVNNCTTSLDLEGIVYERPSLLKKVKGLVDYLLMNEKEATLALGLREFNKQIPLILTRTLDSKAAIVKLGGKGCLIAENNRVVEVPAFKVKVVDTTGAGDAFNAGLIYGILKNLPLTKAAIIANAMGAYNCMGFGARHYPTIEELKEKFPTIKEII